MQYIWQHRLWLQRDMRTVDGQVVQVIDPGRINTGSGPDFFNAKIAIDGHIWAGDVEIHVKATDWYRHGHEGDPAYDSVILHVVDRDDTVIRRSNGEPIPQLRMPCAPQFHLSYKALVSGSDRELPCSSHIRSMPSIYVTDWLSTLGYERIYRKAERITDLIDRFSGDWESACYVTIARGLGFGTNGAPFERLALSVPLSFIGKHSDSITAIEALLFGQSGLIDKPSDHYSEHLKKEYDYLAKKFGLRTPGFLNWKLSGMRPGNFPHRRIATLAAMLAGGPRMLSKLLEMKSADDAARLFAPDMTGYWTSHYNFSSPASRQPGVLGRTSVEGLVINAVVPLQFAYGQTHGDTDMTHRAVDLLMSIPAERNTIVRIFEQAGIKASDAFMSQSLIELRREYCEQRKCLYCRIGHRMLSADARRKE